MGSNGSEFAQGAEFNFCNFLYPLNAFGILWDTVLLHRHSECLKKYTEIMHCQ